MSTLAESSLNASQLDLKHIEMLRTLRNGTLLPQLLHTWRQEAQKQLHDMQDAIQRRDCHVIATLAHSFKSSSYSIGAPHLGAACTELENAARGKDLSNAVTLLAALQQRFMSVQSELEPYFS